LRKRAHFLSNRTPDPRLLTQIQRILEINTVAEVTKAVV